MRADWAIGDTYIEFAGLMARAEYREKMGRKHRLAQEAGIQLQVIQPEDLPRLDAVLKPFLSGGST